MLGEFCCSEDQIAAALANAGPTANISLEDAIAQALTYLAGWSASGSINAEGSTAETSKRKGRDWATEASDAAVAAQRQITELVKLAAPRLLRMPSRP